jgi:hypothetical protein
VWLRDGAVPANVTLLSPDSPLGSRSTWSARLNSTCHEFASLHLGATQKDFLLGVDGYSLLLERGFPLAAASAYLSNTSRSTILPIKYRTGYGVASIFSDFLQLQLGALWPENATTAQLGIELMGDAAFMDAIQGAVERDMGIGDGVVLPIAFALLALMVRSARVLLLVVLSLVVSALVAFGSMFGVTFAIDVMSATMSLMMSVAIALDRYHRCRDLCRDGHCAQERAHADSRALCRRPLVFSC